MNRKTYQPTRRKQAALAICSLVLSLSGCGCSGAHENAHALHVECDESVCTPQNLTETAGPASAGVPERNLIETRTR